MAITAYICGQQSLFRAANRCRLEASGGAVTVFTPYSAEFVADLKNSIPAHHRSWNKARRAWLVDPARAEAAAKLILSHFGETVDVPRPEAEQEFEATVRVEYLGRCKDRGDGEANALGYDGGDWSLVFPEKVLRQWFEPEAAQSGDEPAPAASGDCYRVLRIKRDAAAQDVKNAYRRLARQWHPDVCREPDARERFEAIKKAYDTLADPVTRKRYDLGLRLQKQAGRTFSAAPRTVLRSFGYSPDLRCGTVRVRAVRSAGRTSVTAILDWKEIENDAGETLVTSWDIDGNCVHRTWVPKGTVF